MNSDLDVMLLLENKLEVLNTSAVSNGVRMANELSARIDTHIAEAWKLGVILGGGLMRMKESIPHGGFKKLFGKSASCCTFEFGYRSASNYMKLYKLAVKKAKSLSLEEEILTLLASPDDPRLSELLSELTDAKSMRQAMEELKEEHVPSFSAPNTKGRVSKPAESVISKLEEEEELASEGLHLQAVNLQEMIKDGSLIKASAEAQLELLSALVTAKNIIDNALRS